jgi:hypothetical protein
MGKGRLFIAQLCDMRRLHQRVPELAGTMTDLVKDPAPDLPGTLRERLERGRSIVLFAQPTHCPRNHGFVAAGWPYLRFAAERTLIFLVKRIRPRGCGNTDLSSALAPKINTDIPVPVDILDKEPINAYAALVAEADLHHKSSHSFFGSAASSSAAKAASSFIRSQITRPSMRLGLGIRPSSTISSNFVTPTPI